MLTVARRVLSGDPEALDAALHPVLRRIYAARGIRAMGELAQTLDGLLPVGTLSGVAAAAALLCAHRGNRITVVGDFDADGATSTALVLRALRAWGFADVDHLVPNRFEFGYGLTPEIVQVAIARSPQLIVTVDNGVASNAGVAAARAAGIDVLVTDHHLAGDLLPTANVIVNPNLPGSDFGSRALAGVGVAFYVLAALRRQLDVAGLLPPGAPPVTQWLDLVALGTVADVVPLDRNNRVLVAQGTARIRAGRCVPGISALLAVANRDPAQIVASDLGFAVAPRINAAGRLSDMSLGIRCLLSDDLTEARALAEELHTLNQKRREIEADMQVQALAAVRRLRADASPAATPGVAADDRRATRAGIVLFDPGWHQGVVGLVASRIKEQLRRPVIAFAPVDAAQLRGSARSVPGVHVRDVLAGIDAQHPGLIGRFGGHAMAAGLSLELSHLDRFAREFDAEVARWLAALGSPDVIETDGELDEKDIALPTAVSLRGGGPWGSAFPEPLFDGVFEIRSSRIIGERHLKLQVAAPEGRGVFEAIAFNCIDPAAPRPAPAGRQRLVYRLGTNEYRGDLRLQLVVEHWLPA
jgi:single-stranded-DNA-specific exonuclease